MPDCGVSVTVAPASMRTLAQVMFPHATAMLSAVCVCRYLCVMSAPYRSSKPVISDNKKQTDGKILQNTVQSETTER